MLYNLMLWLLGPLLWMQGIRVRKMTPRLPEPPGPRAGVNGSGPDLRLLILGDSAAAGVGADSQQDALAGRLVDALAGRFCVHWQLWADTGRDSAQVLELLQQQSAVRFDVAVISVGVNDVTGRVSLALWQKNLQAIRTVLEEKFGARSLLFSSVPPMHRFPALPQPLRFWLGARARMFNRDLQIFATKNSRCRWVATEFPLVQAMMAKDGFHPGPQAYELWAQQLAQVIRAEVPGSQEVILADSSSLEAGGLS